MIDQDVQIRVDRLHAALGRFETRDFRGLPAKFIARPGLMTIHQDFSGGQTEAEMSEALHAIINGVASFPDHLKQWGRRHSVSDDSIHNYFKDSTDFCIVRDLWNNDKHGYPPIKDGWSRKAPRILHVRRVLEMKTGPQENSTANFGMTPNGCPVISGNGDGRAVLTGEVVDKLGNGLGEAHNFIERAISLCEASLRTFGVSSAIPK